MANFPVYHEKTDVPAVKNSVKTILPTGSKTDKVKSPSTGTIPADTDGWNIMDSGKGGKITRSFELVNLYLQA